MNNKISKSTRLALEYHIRMNTDRYSKEYLRDLSNSELIDIYNKLKMIDVKEKNVRK